MNNDFKKLLELFASEYGAIENNNLASKIRTNVELDLGNVGNETYTVSIRILMDESTVFKTFEPWLYVMNEYGIYYKVSISRYLSKHIVVTFDVVGTCECANIPYSIYHIHEGVIYLMMLLNNI